MDLLAFVTSAVIAALTPSQPMAVTNPTPTHVWPLEPHPIVRGFEPPSTRWSAGHRGVDIGGFVGEPVVSSTDGTVTYAGELAGRGVVVVSFGDERMTYEPIVSSVQRGDIVRAGQRIGVLDVEQSHCLPLACLHWGLLRGQTYLDPTLTMGVRQIRLLPLMPEDAPGDTPS